MVSKNEIAELVAGIHASKILGRSAIYPRLLDYLVEKSSTGQSCREVELAENVFFKNDTFDQTTDSSVRVYVHNLRKKLQLYYRGQGQKTPYRIHIPKGEYRVEVLDPANYAQALTGKTAPPQIQQPSYIENSNPWRKYPLWVGISVLCGLIALVSFAFYFSQQPSPPNFSDEQHIFWGGILSDDKPVHILLDNSTGRFGIQSLSISSVTSEQSDSDAQKLQQAEIPELLIRLVGMLDDINRPVEIHYLSEFSPKDITGENHIIYTDHIDGISKLAELFVGLEQLEPAGFVPSLLSKQTEVLHSRDLSADNPKANDYGVIFKQRLQFPDMQPFELIVLSGSGFTGQSTVLQIAQSNSVLTEMQLTASETSSGGLSALFQVTASGGFLPERALLSSESH